VLNPHRLTWLRVWALRHWGKTVDWTFFANGMNQRPALISAFSLSMAVVGFWQH